MNCRPHRVSGSKTSAWRWPGHYLRQLDLLFLRFAIGSDIRMWHRLAGYSQKALACLRLTFAVRWLAGKTIQSKRSEIVVAFAVDNQVFGQLSERASILEPVSAQPGNPPGARVTG